MKDVSTLSSRSHTLHSDHSQVDSSDRMAARSLVKSLIKTVIPGSPIGRTPAWWWRLLRSPMLAATVGAPTPKES